MVYESVCSCIPPLEVRKEAPKEEETVRDPKHNGYTTAEIEGGYVYNSPNPCCPRFMEMLAGYPVILIKAGEEDPDKVKFQNIQWVWDYIILPLRELKWGPLRSVHFEGTRIEGAPNSIKFYDPKCLPGHPCKINGCCEVDLEFKGTDPALPPTKLLMKYPCNGKVFVSYDRSDWSNVHTQCGTKYDYWPKRNAGEYPNSQLMERTP